jgi:uncharacterized protein YbjT (DUF2867 family)
MRIAILGGVNVLVTGVSGYVGAALAPRLLAAGHAVRGLARDRRRVTVAGVPVVEGDALTGAGLAEAFEDVELAYYLIHAMEPSTDGRFPERERRAAANVVRAACAAGVRRIVYLGGLVPARGRRASDHLASRLAVEELLLEGVPDSIALRASIVIGARSRSFRFLVRLIERLPVLALPAWQRHRTQPIDERDLLEYLLRAADHPGAGGRSLDIAGPEAMTYGDLIERIRDHMLVARPAIRLRELSATPIASVIAAAVAGEEHALIGPLMEGLEGDLLPRDDAARELFGVRLHTFDAAVEHALREWEAAEPLRAR